MPVEPGTGCEQSAFPVSSRRTTMLLAHPAELLGRIAVLIYVLAGSGGEHGHVRKRLTEQSAVAKSLDWAKLKSVKQTGHPLNGWRVDHRGMIRDAQRHSIGVWGVDSDDAGSQR